MRAYLVGIKGSGMAHLALLLKEMDYSVSGCDSSEVFSTDALLEDAGIYVDTGFSASLLPSNLSLLIYSSAYDLSIPILQAAQNQGISPISYPDFLATLSQKQRSWAVAGTHGKSTACAVATYLLYQESEGTFPFYSLYGSSLIGIGQPPFWGAEHALFEACEYRDHFLAYSLHGVLITSVTHDHVDYFPNPEAVLQSFQALVDRIEAEGVLIYNADDRGAALIGSYAEVHRPDLTLIGYGAQASGDFKTVFLPEGSVRLKAVKKPIELTVVETPLIANHIGALLLAQRMLGNTAHLENLSDHLTNFPGLSGRLEWMESIGELHFYDDYAHHPREVVVTLNEVKRRYPNHRCLVLFSPHTGSRTVAFFDEFLSAFSAVDYLIVQPTYASARGDGLSGKSDPAHDLYTSLKQEKSVEAYWANDDEAAVALAVELLQEPSVCITMGAGNNRALSEAIVRAIRSHP